MTGLKIELDIIVKKHKVFLTPFNFRYEEYAIINGYTYYRCFITICFIKIEYLWKKK